MGIKDTWAVKQLVAATQQLHATRLYERYADSDFFLMHTPRLDDPVVAVLMGNGGQTYGLNLYLGADAEAYYGALLDARSDSEARMAMMRSHMLGYCMVEGAGLCFEARKWLKKAKVKPERGRLYPDPMYVQPGKVPVVGLKDPQTHLLQHLVRGILAAAEDKAFKPCGRDGRGRVLAVTLTKDRENPQVTIGWQQAEPGAAGVLGSTQAPAVGLFADDRAVRPAFDLNGLARSGDSWLVSMMPAPGYIHNDDRQPFMLLVCSEMDRGMWPCLVMGAEGQVVVDQLAALMRDQPQLQAGYAGMLDTGLTPPPPGLPERLLADSTALQRVLERAFGPLGIECHDGGDDPAMQSMFAQFKDIFEESLDDGAFDDALLQQLGDQPDDDDINGWKRVDGYIKVLVHNGFKSDPKFRGTRALNRYFGPDADPMQLMIDYRHIMAIDSYALWFATRYRSTRKMPTRAEAWLEEPGIPRPVKHLLRAILEQAPSIYRLGEADEDTGKIEYQDLFTGEITIVTDYNLVTCVKPGMMLPVLLVPAGDFHLFYPAGPIMNSHQLNAAMNLFDDLRSSADPAQALRDQPHLLGRLWDLLDQALHHKPTVYNTDGHELTPHTAVFACPDPKAVERFLEQRDDYIREDRDTWNWFREGAPTPQFKSKDTATARVAETHQDTSQGPITLLGQVTLADGKLTLTVNSRERMSAARALLELIDGVTLHSVESKTTEAMFDELEQERANPIDTFDPSEDADHDPGEFDEASAQAASAYIVEHYKRWLDMPLPMLKNLTPRQAAQDPKQRHKVAALIRSIPDPTDLGKGGIQIAAPREQLLKELGLDERQ